MSQNISAREAASLLAHYFGLALEEYGGLNADCREEVESIVSGVIAAARKEAAEDVRQDVGRELESLRKRIATLESSIASLETRVEKG